MNECIYDPKGYEKYKTEIDKLRILLFQNNYKIIYETQSSRNYWLDNSYAFPHLTNLAIIYARKIDRKKREALKYVGNEE